MSDPRGAEVAAILLENVRDEAHARARAAELDQELVLVQTGSLPFITAHSCSGSISRRYNPSWYVRKARRLPPERLRFSHETLSVSGRLYLRSTLREPGSR